MKQIKLLHTTLLFLFIALIFTTPIYSQGWKKQYNAGTNFFHESTFFQTSDNGFIIVAGQSSEPFNNDTLVIIRTDENGIELSRTKHDEYRLDPIKGDHRIIGFPDDSFIVSVLGNIVGTTNYKLVKFAGDGTFIWEKEGFRTTSMDRTLDNGIILAANNRLIKIDEDGNTIWIMDMADNAYPASITSLASGGYAVTGSKYNDSFFITPYPYLAKIDTDGNIIWDKLWESPGYGYGASLIETLDGNLLLTGTISPDSLVNSEQMFLTKVDQSGEDLWNINTGHIYSTPASLIEGDNHRYYITGTAIDLTGNLINLFIASYDEAGNENFKRDYDFFGYDEGQQIIHLSNNEFAILGTTERQITNPNGIRSDVLLLKIDEEGYIFSNLIEGNVLYDQDENCTVDAGETGLAGWVVTAAGLDNYYSYTDEDGNYSINLDVGSYDLNIQPFGYWDPCESSYQIDVEDTSPPIIIQDFSVKGAADCPYPIVDIATNVLRPCRTNYYWVNYCNYGTVDIEDATIQVTLDPNMTYVDASIPLISQVDQMLTFDVGDVGINECNNFVLFADLACDTLLIGQTLCVEAHFFPDSICLTPPWNGPIIEADGSCDDNVIEFLIRNVGEDMPAATDYIIVEDNIILRQEPFQLDANAEETVTVNAAEGSTYHLMVSQQDNFPAILGNILVTNSIEGCNGEVTTGLFNNFQNDDGEDYLSIHCQEVVAAYDPNDKQAFPTGWKEENFIDNTTDLEYMIRFQNTGNDTAFLVVLKDQLSEFLNPASIRPGASSHPYTFDLGQNGEATFTFENILLPDSTTNFVASQGFVKFKIAQRANNTPGTVIYNKAAIYFDINSPVITNEVFHTIQEDWISILLDSDDLAANEPAMISIQPNPFNESTVLQLSVVPNENAVLQIYDLNGRSIREEYFVDQQFILHRKNLTSGLYIYTLNVDGIIVDQGKIMIH